jgi:hypothetical protein
LFLYNSGVFSQIDLVSIQGIDCNNNSGFIKLELGLDFVIEDADQWSYEPYDSTEWQDIDQSSTFSVNYDTLHTTTCGKYGVVITDVSSFPFSYDTLIFFIPCPVTVGLGQLQKISCHNDSSGVLFAPTFGGIPFDPDSSTFDSLGIYSPNDTTGDEYYKYEWFVGPNDTSLSNWTSIGDSTNILNNIYSRFYSIIVSDAVGCRDTLSPTDSTFWQYVNNPYKLKIDSLGLVASDVSCYNGQDGNINISVKGGRKFRSNRNYNYYILDSIYNIIHQSDNSVVSQNFSQLSSLTDSSLIIDHVFFDDLSPGTYNLLVEDSFECILDTFFIIDEPDQYEFYTSKLDSLDCLSDTVWLYIDSVTGGQGTQNYYWNDSPNQSDSIWGTEGLYSIIVEDTIYNCFDSVSVNIQVKYEIFASYTITNVDCYGESTGKIQIDSLKTEDFSSTYSWKLEGFTSFANDSLFENLSKIII